MPDFGKSPHDPAGHVPGRRRDCGEISQVLLQLSNRVSPSLLHTYGCFVWLLALPAIRREEAATSDYVSTVYRPRPLRQCKAHRPEGRHAWPSANAVGYPIARCVLIEVSARAAVVAGRRPGQRRRSLGG